MTDLRSRSAPGKPLDSRAPLAMPGALVVVVLTLLIAIQPVTTDLYLPALPSLRADFNAPVSVVQLTLSALILCFGVSQLAWGPVSDRLGRRPVLLAGLTLYTFAAIAGALAPSIEVLVAARSVQGIGMAASLVCGRAMVSDLFEAQQGTHVMTKAMSLLASIAISVPVLGGVIAAHFGWRACLLATALFAVATLALLVLRVPETAFVLNPAATRIQPLLRAYREIARHPTFIAWTALSTLGYAANFYFFSASSYVYIGEFGVSREVYGIILGSGSVAYLAGTIACRRWIGPLGIQGAVRRAAWFTMLAVALFALPLVVGGHSALTLTVALWLQLFGYGIHQPCGQVGLAQPFPLLAGTASALGGFMLAAGAFASSAWLGFNFDGTSRSLATTASVLIAVCGAVALTLVQRHGDARVKSALG